MAAPVQPNHENCEGNKGEDEEEPTEEHDIEYDLSNRINELSKYSDFFAGELKLKQDQRWRT
uniref:Uncharacterized protein n=1 Tax=Kalanchoe fedtschenkoi TaxID=63787 RepID=A0A7N0UL17_KALFE